MTDFSKYTPALQVKLKQTCKNIDRYFMEHDHILVSVSGGSDSDIILDIICRYHPKYLQKIHFVHVNTGLEYRATEKHIKYLENEYGIKIQTIRGKSIVNVVHDYGVPLFNKRKSAVIEQFCKGSDKAAVTLYKKYKGDFEFTDRQRACAEYVKENNIKVSAKCCVESKKKPLHEYCKIWGIDLNVTGERKAEGGVRVLHESCFIRSDTRSKFMPIYWWSDAEKQEYKCINGLYYSDCYEVWGLRRTGCVGCPFCINLREQLSIIKEYEPMMYKACMCVFGTAYDLYEKFNIR